MSDPVVIVSANRTPLGAFQGLLKGLSATDLGAESIKAIINSTGIDKKDIDAVIMGCVLSAGLGQAPARQAAIKAGLANTVDCTTVNKVCGSALKTIMFGCDAIKAGSANVIVAGGMESMSNAPYVSIGARSGLRMGHHQLVDHMLYDGLQDSFSNGTLMGVFAENTVKKYNFTRQQQDDFAIKSMQKACTARESGFFKQEMIPLRIKQAKDELVIQYDELLVKIKLDRIPNLKPVFIKDGTVTAANSSAISDGASTVLLMKKSEAKKRKLEVLATINSYASHAHEPEWFTTAPVQSIKSVVKNSGWSIKDVDLFEINEAFAVVPMVAMKECKIAENKVNVNGGACALGHPIGASGARILTTLIHSLKRLNKTKGIASLCIGGGEAVAMSISV